MPNGTFQAVLKLSGQLRRLLVGLYVYGIQTGMEPGFSLLSLEKQMAGCSIVFKFYDVNVCII